MNNLPENSLHCEQLGSFCLMVNKEKIDGNVPGGTFEKAGFVKKKKKKKKERKKETPLPSSSDTKKFNLKAFQFLSLTAPQNIIYKIRIYCLLE